jgi:hypothetical protein
VKSTVIACLASVGLLAGGGLPATARAEWSPGYFRAKTITANVVNDRYGIDARPSEVGCLTVPRRKKQTTRSKAHRWDCVWVHTVEHDGDSEKVCGGRIRLTGSNDGEYDSYYTVRRGKSCEWY